MEKKRVVLKLFAETGHDPSKRLIKTRCLAQETHRHTEVKQHQSTVAQGYVGISLFYQHQREMKEHKERSTLQSCPTW